MEEANSNRTLNVEHFAVEVDGVRRVENQTFSEAIKAAMKIRKGKPGSHVLLRDEGEQGKVSYDERTLVCD